LLIEILLAILFINIDRKSSKEKREKIIIEEKE